MARVAFWREERVLAQPVAKSPTRGNVAGFAGEALAQARQTALRMAFHSEIFDQSQRERITES